jgi:hypothetical protein
VAEMMPWASPNNCTSHCINQVRLQQRRIDAQAQQLSVCAATVNMQADRVLAWEGHLQNDTTKHNHPEPIRRLPAVHPRTILQHTAC